jgi:hypothetical protein
MKTIFSVIPFALVLMTSHALASDYSQSNYSQLQIDELMKIADMAVFPDSPIAAVDPLSKEKVDAVLVGPTLKADEGAGFDYYRYVTFYNIDQRKEQITTLPILTEQCSDNSEEFGKYEYSYSYSASVTATESLDGLGLSETLSKTQTLTTTRSVRAVGDIVATHTPYMIKQDWSGRSFIQTYTNRSHKVAFEMQQQEHSSWWMAIFFPVLSHSEYPMPFDVKNASWTFEVDRVISQRCAPSADDGDANVPPTEHKKMLSRDFNK